MSAKPICQACGNKVDKVLPSSVCVDCLEIRKKREAILRRIAKQTPVTTLIPGMIKLARQGR